MRLGRSFFIRDVLIVAPELIGKTLIRVSPKGSSSFIISEVEAYRGKEDEASHARFGKTSRNMIMYQSGGLIYVYFIYGMYWMINIVTGDEGQPQAVLIRGLNDIEGPGKVTKKLEIDRTFYGEDLTTSNRIWIEDHRYCPGIIQKPRFGIDYANEPWKSMPWRYIIQPPQKS